MVLKHIFWKKGKFVYQQSPERTGYIGGSEAAEKEFLAERLKEVLRDERSAARKVERAAKTLPSKEELLKMDQASIFQAFGLGVYNTRWSYLNGLHRAGVKLFRTNKYNPNAAEIERIHKRDRSTTLSEYISEKAQNVLLYFFLIHNRDAIVANAPAKSLTIPTASEITEYTKAQLEELKISVESNEKTTD